MSKLKTLKDLYIHQLRDLYSAENQLTKALPKMEKAATSPTLKAAFKAHLKETEGQIARLETIFEGLGEKPGGVTCKAMEGLVAEGAEAISEDAEDSIRDAALIAAAQRVEHYEMAGYGTVRAYAKHLKMTGDLKHLEETFQEEEAADEKLTKIAESEVNLQGV